MHWFYAILQYPFRKLEGHFLYFLTTSTAGNIAFSKARLLQLPGALARPTVGRYCTAPLALAVPWIGWKKLPTWLNCITLACFFTILVANTGFMIGIPDTKKGKFILVVTVTGNDTQIRRLYSFPLVKRLLIKTDSWYGLEVWKLLFKMFKMGKKTLG